MRLNALSWCVLGTFAALSGCTCIDPNEFKNFACDGSACGTGGAKRQSAKLQLGGGGLGALSDQVQCKFPVIAVLRIVEHLEPIDDCANRADEIVAHPGTQQRGEFDLIGQGRTRTGLGD